MMLHLSTAKYLSLISWKTYINPGQGIAGDGNTPSESIRDWLNNFETYLKNYESGEMSLSKLCENLGVSLDTGKQILQAENIALDLGVSNEADLEEDIKNA
ncbi:hypothetical protein [Nostoc sp. TCL240-02]|uniref:hypothetical protein n=1 Tax=Nostoc sp. TCL240-02 TaxID=2572090 RepID=UPI00157F8615|nr:hypothetical protein [Nostoc sp. TCL240-02]QKQ75650.1 hypothetical protein FBB35_22245 [Nostoc sp. TCL240-02]